MKKVLLIGGGIGQLPIAQKLKKREVCLIVIAYHCIDEVRTLADKYIQQDLFDYEGVLEIAKKEKIDAVISDQHDLFIPVVAYIAEKLNLPGNKFDQVQTYCDKNKFRDICDKLNVPVPKHISIKDEIFPAELRFPIVVKPADAQSSLGISKVSSNEQYQDAVKKALFFSRCRYAIAEEYFEGQEIVSEGLIHNGSYFNLALGDRSYFKLQDLFIPAQTLFPSEIPEKIRKKIIEFETRIAREVRPSFAIVHTEWLWNKENNQLCCVESALRGGGVYISSDIIPKCTGLDINSLLIDFVLGESIDVPEFISHKEMTAAGYICFYLHEGKISKIDGLDKIAKLEGVNRISLEGLTVGKDVQIMTHKGHRYGPILISASNRTFLEDLIKECQTLLDITVHNSVGDWPGPIWE